MPDQPPADPLPPDPLSGDEFARHDQAVRDADWQPPRGPLTRLVAWAILLSIAACVLGMIALVVARLAS